MTHDHKGAPDPHDTARATDDGKKHDAVWEVGKRFAGTSALRSFG